ncbi:alpha/beta fold hydrolase [Nocardia pseudobrasiliensis]|uniref:Alpha-beta hydrolase superfamily lysophospholipase n=1 Tax=Nocardia pseudobrasiliensis TaxID=45979 RepID=A0A370IB76_9NOCA|nr:alpha/beta hydrolase [Nocardia pseudobrasiliensis]RDI67957.1 alpha-beta hydrolase superfamily lysophospholipase [Nocardia pseudobrasiliensis]
MNSMHSQGEPGTFSTRDGRELFYMHRVGGAPGAPMVVFEGGMACSRSYWAPVQVALGARAASVVYDRCGLGRSAPDPVSRALSRVVADQGELLEHLTRRFDPPGFLLVGHSWGGAIVRAATTGPAAQRISGAVLIEPTDEACDALFTPAMRRAERIGQFGSSLLARIGVLHLAFRDLLAAMPADARADMRAEGFTPAAMRTRGAEIETLIDDLYALRGVERPVPDIPVTIVSGARTSAGMGTEIRAAANATNTARSATYPRGRHVLALNSGHAVPVTEPDLVAAEIVRVIGVCCE